MCSIRSRSVFGILADPRIVYSVVCSGSRIWGVKASFFIGDVCAHPPGGYYVSFPFNECLLVPITLKVQTCICVFRAKPTPRKVYRCLLTWWVLRCAGKGQVMERELCSHLYTRDPNLDILNKLGESRNRRSLACLWALLILLLGYNKSNAQQIFVKFWSHNKFRVPGWYALRACIYSLARLWLRDCNLALFGLNFQYAGSALSVYIYLLAALQRVSILACFLPLQGGNG